MATVDLLPNGNGYSTQWVLAAGTRPSCLWTNDGATSYIQKDSSSVGIDSYTLDDMPVGVDSINSVTAYAIIGRSGASAGNGNIGCRYSSTNLLNTAALFPGSWAGWNFPMANAPGGGAWSVAVLNSTEVLIRAQGDGTGGVNDYCTQLYVHVDYNANSVFLLILSWLLPLLGAGVIFSQFKAALGILARQHRNRPRFTEAEQLELWRAWQEHRHPHSLSGLVTA